MRKLLAAILLLCGSAFATTPVVGNLKDLTGTAVGSPNGSFARFYLRGCGKNQPRVPASTSAIAPHAGTNGIFFFDIPADSSGALSATVYSTRDAAGTGNGEIECGGSFKAVWYGVVFYANGVPGPETAFVAENGVTLSLPTAVPLSVLPVVTAPDGDVIYVRLDGANSPMTGPLEGPGFNNIINVARYPGTDVATKTTNAQNACPGGGASCVLMFSTSLYSTTIGSMPARCANCIWLDYRSKEALIGNTSAYTPGAMYSMVAGSGTGRVFTSASECLATNGGDGTLANGECVGLFAGASRTAGTRPVWAFNALANCTAAGNGCSAIEADLNNNSGTDATISSNATDLQFGLRAVSGGANNPQAGVRIDASSGGAAWKEGLQVFNYDTHGIRVAGPNIGLIIVPDVVDGAAEVVGTDAAGASGPWQINHNGSAYFGLGNTAIDTAGVITSLLSATPGVNPAVGYAKFYIDSTTKEPCSLDSSGVTHCAGAGGGGSPGSPDTSVQFACSGIFCGTSNMLWDDTNQTFGLNGGFNITTGATIGGQKYGIKIGNIGDFDGTDYAIDTAFGNDRFGSGIVLFDVDGSSPVGTSVQVTKDAAVYFGDASTNTCTVSHTVFSETSSVPEMDMCATTGSIPVIELYGDSHSATRHTEITSDTETRVNDIGSPSTETISHSSGNASGRIINVSAPAGSALGIEVTATGDTAAHSSAFQADNGWISSEDGFRYNNANAHTQPTCSATYRGLTWDIWGAAGVADILQVCMKDAANAYAWHTVTIP